MRTDPLLFPAFCVFAQGQLDSGDLDPTYPVLRALYDMQELPEETRLWRTLLYVTFYNLSSAERAWTAFPTPRELPNDLRLPTGIERRGFRGNNLASVHVNSVLAMVRRFGSLEAWARASTAAGGKDGWRHARAAFQQMPYVGSWSSYKWVDLLKNVHGHDITANDIGLGGGSATAGPVFGLSKIAGVTLERAASDVPLQEAVMAEACARGVRFNGLDQFETACCDFGSLLKGRYYVGHDIDQQQEYLAGCSDALWMARAASFAPRYLGERNGWTGVRKELCKLFVRTGEVYL